MLPRGGQCIRWLTAAAVCVRFTIVLRRTRWTVLGSNVARSCRGVRIRSSPAAMQSAAGRDEPLD